RPREPCNDGDELCRPRPLPRWHLRSSSAPRRPPWRRVGKAATALTAIAIITGWAIPTRPGTTRGTPTASDGANRRLTTKAPARAAGAFFMLPKALRHVANAAAGLHNVRARAPGRNVGRGQVPRIRSRGSLHESLGRHHSAA